MSRPLSVDDVHRLLVERLRSGIFPIGSRLPSVRKLADELGSNPSTVDRALHRLAQVGSVRTVPRQGTYVSAIDVPADAFGWDSEGDMLGKVLASLRASGMSWDGVRELVNEKLHEVFQDPKILFLECNTIDLESMADMVTNATGVDLIPRLIDELSDSIEDNYDVIAVPLFHMADLAGKVRDYGKVVELTFHASPNALRQLATLDRTSRVIVSANTERGKERILSLTRQYYAGDVSTHHSLNDPPEFLLSYDAVVFTNAAQLDPEVIEKISRPIRIEWELDPGSSSTFLLRAVEAASI